MNREEFIKKWVLFEDGQMVKDLDELLSLPPAEGAEKLKEMEELFNLEQQLDIPMKDRFHNSAKGKELFAAIQNKPHPTAEGAGKTCHAKEMEYNHNMCAMQESCEKCEAYKVPTNEGDIAKTETDTGRIVDMPDLSQPTAEGAEEILQKTTLSDTSVPNVPLSWLIDPESPTWNAVIAAMHEFATLHAQRIADKMVEERMEQYKAQFKDRPNPLEVNPYDSKGIKRIRNRKIH